MVPFFSGQQRYEFLLCFVEKSGKITKVAFGGRF